MCGLSGFFDSSGQNRPEAFQAVAERMAGTLCHRGPDDNGEWVDVEAGIALGHRRLAIIDRSSQGSQPMHSNCGRYVTAYNGEIYNFRNLRRELEGLGHPFRGNSDTEVALAAIAQWGLETAVDRFNGMFVFALWDRKHRALHLVRDRIGIKPLYYGWTGDAFVFGSELKAIRAYPGFKAEIDRDALALYLRHSYVPTPYSIYKGIRKLKPGSILTIDAAKMGHRPEPVAYWSVREAASNGVAHPYTGAASEAIEQLDELLREAVKLRLVADVPLGAFLSGGIDSSTVVSMMQAQAASPVKTFSIGFHESRYNEAGHAKVVAERLGTEHTELYVSPGEAMGVVPRLPVIYDEPFSDSSQIPTFLVSELARRHVSVSLSGDGGDELFFGYPRYALGQNIWKVLGTMPRPGRHTLAKALSFVPAHQINGVLGMLPPAMTKGGELQQNVHRLQRMSEILAVDNPEELYQGLVSHWVDPSSVVAGATAQTAPSFDGASQPDLPGFAHRMMFLDMVGYLPDDILTKVDRASMSVGLEARVPLLDHRVIEFAWRLPHEMKVRAGQSKWILRQVLERYVPSALTGRPKMGFGVPIDVWLRGPLRDWAEDLLAEQRLRDEGFFNPRPVRQKLAEHVSGKRRWHHHLWDVLMFQAWWENQSKDTRADSPRTVVWENTQH